MHADLYRALLEVIAVRLATHRDAVEDYVRRTLLYHTLDSKDLNDMVETTIDDLEGTKLITVDCDGAYEATLLGQAIVTSSLDPADGLFVHSELERALRAFVMDGEMHIFYMFTPVHQTGLGDVNWPIFRKEVDRLDESGLRVLQFCGISPGFVNRMYVRTFSYNNRSLSCPGQIVRRSYQGTRHKRLRKLADIGDSMPRFNYVICATKSQSTPSLANMICHEDMYKHFHRPVRASRQA